MPRARLVAGLALLAATASLSACLLPPAAPTVIASAGGTGPQDAYRVASVAQELEVLRLLSLQPVRQEVRVLNGQPFDVVTAINHTTREERVVWFDITRFYGRS